MCMIFRHIGRLGTSGHSNYSYQNNNLPCVQRLVRNVKNTEEENAINTLFQSESLSR
jgi:hypothetical protein